MQSAVTAQPALRVAGARRRTGASYGLYLNNPGTATTEDLVTDICIPVETA